MITIEVGKEVSDDKRLEIARYLTTKFGLVVAARASQIDGNYQRWIDNYNAKPNEAVRTTPFLNASNFMPQLIRMHTDILTARLIGILMGTRPFWRPTSFVENVPTNILNSLGAWMQYQTFNKIDMYPVIDSLVHNCFKSGATVLKEWWQEDTKYVMKGVGNDGKAVETGVTRKGLKMCVVPFEDFYPYPLTSLSLETCSIKFHRLRLTEEEVRFRKNLKLWDDKATDLLLSSKGTMGSSSSQEQELQWSGIALTVDVGQPYTAIEATFDYELSPGKRYPLMAVFNPSLSGKGSLLRLYYKPGSNPNLDAFTDFHLLPKTGSFYDDCIPSILEGSQEEQAQIHNSRRDANAIANVPAWKKKRYADVANPSTEWYPGKVFEVDNMDDLVPLEFGGNYNSMVEEESFLLQLAERYTGVSPAMQGAGNGGAGKRGTYASQGTMALIAEGNRRIDVYMKRFRSPFNRVGHQIYESQRDFGDNNEWSKWGPHGTNLQKAFSKDSQLSGGDTFFELSASDSGANREADRSGLLLMANTMSSYYHELVQAAQTVASVPDGSPFKELMLEVLDGARDLAERLLFQFDIGDREKLLPDMRKLFGGGPQGPEGPQEGPGTPNNQRLPQPQGDVSGQDVSNLAQQLTSLTNGRGQGPPQ